MQIKLRTVSLLNLFCSALLLCYFYFFLKSVSFAWFNPRWTSDDALQQLIPLHAVFHPHIFENDLIAQVMKGYLLPLHYGLAWIFTYLSGSPIMSGHLLMLIQLGLVMLCVFLLVRRYVGFAPACLALIWLLHSRHLVQRTTAGLPRGWAPAILAATLLFVALRKHGWVWCVLFMGALLNPPATFLAGVSYGLFVLFHLISKKTRTEYTRPFLALCILTPILGGLVIYLTKRPPEVGNMVSYQQAMQMPEFQRQGGRFAFLPFQTPQEEIKRYGFQAFIGKLYKPSVFWKRNIYTFVLAILAGLLIWQILKRRELIPRELLLYLCAIMLVYFLSRPLAFHLYLPDRHLRAPLAIFFITAFSIGIWRAFEKFPNSASFAHNWRALLAMCALAYLVVCGSGSGLEGNANFNYVDTKKGMLSIWLRNNTPENSLIAGYPSQMDPVPLYGMRRVLASSETWHPFYLGYNEEIKRRLEISLRAHYAKSLAELAALLEHSGVDYFAFERAQFYPEALQKASFFEPFGKLVRELSAGPPEKYAYRELPLSVDLKRYPFMPFRDDKSALVDMAKLREYLAGRRG